MPYLVAKNFYQHGCYAMPVEHGPELVELKHDLQAATPLGTYSSLPSAALPHTANMRPIPLSKTGKNLFAWFSK